MVNRNYESRSKTNPGTDKDDLRGWRVIMDRAV